jgi:AMMECR1 domain-containing protein
MFVRITSVGNKFFQPLFLLPEVYTENIWSDSKWLEDLLIKNWKKTNCLIGVQANFRQKSISKIILVDILPI